MSTITVASMVKNEANNYLESCLSAWSDFADEILILDDNSTDSTADLCRSAGATVVPWKGMAAWGCETQPRKTLWQKAVETGTDFIFVLDADMVPARDPRDLLIGGTDGVAFTLFDLWGEDCFRSDYLWQGHEVPRLWIVRNNQKNRSLSWSGRHIHSGHFPTNLKLDRVVIAPRDYSLLHYAYVTSEDRTKKKKQYLSKGHLLTTHEWIHATSIDDPEPNTLPLDIAIRWPLRKSKSDPQSDNSP